MSSKDPKQLLESEEIETKAKYKTIFNNRKISKKLPPRGAKFTKQTNTWLEEKQVEEALDWYIQLLSEERFEKTNRLIICDWIDEDKEAKVVKNAGNFLEVFGHSKNGVEYLYPEEALFLVEMRRLQLLLHGNSMSIQRCYGMLLNENSSCTMDEYRVFHNLCALGYKLYRYKFDLGDVSVTKCGVVSKCNTVPEYVVPSTSEALNQSVNIRNTVAEVITEYVRSTLNTDLRVFVFDKLIESSFSPDLDLHCEETGTGSRQATHLIVDLTIDSDQSSLSINNVSTLNLNIDSDQSSLHANNSSIPLDNANENVFTRGNEQIPANNMEQTTDDANVNDILHPEQPYLNPRQPHNQFSGGNATDSPANSVHLDPNLNRVGWIGYRAATEICNDISRIVLRLNNETRRGENPIPNHPNNMLHVGHTCDHVPRRTLVPFSHYIPLDPLVNTCDCGLINVPARNQIQNHFVDYYALPPNLYANPNRNNYAVRNRYPIRYPVRNRQCDPVDNQDLYTKQHPAPIMEYVIEDGVGSLRRYEPPNNNGVNNTAPPNNVPLNNVPPNNVQLNNVPPNNLLLNNVPLNNVRLNNVPPNNVPLNNVRLNNVPPNNAPLNNVRLNNVPPNNVPLNNVRLNNVPPNNVPLNNVPLNNVRLNNVPPNNVPLNNVRLNNVPPNNVPLNNVPLNNVRLNNVPPNNVPLNNVRFNNVRFNNVPPNNTPNINALYRDALISNMSVNTLNRIHNNNNANTVSELPHLRTNIPNIKPEHNPNSNNSRGTNQLSQAAPFRVPNAAQLNPEIPSVNLVTVKNEQESDANSNTALTDRPNISIQGLRTVNPISNQSGDNINVAPWSDVSDFPIFYTNNFNNTNNYVPNMNISSTTTSGIRSNYYNRSRRNDYSVKNNVLANGFRMSNNPGGNNNLYSRRPVFHRNNRMPGWNTYMNNNQVGHNSNGNNGYNNYFRHNGIKYHNSYSNRGQHKRFPNNGENQFNNNNNSNHGTNNSSNSNPDNNNPNTSNSDHCNNSDSHDNSYFNHKRDNTSNNNSNNYRHNNRKRGNNFHSNRRSNFSVPGFQSVKMEISDQSYENRTNQRRFARYHNVNRSNKYPNKEKPTNHKANYRANYRAVRNNVNGIHSRIGLGFKIEKLDGYMEANVPNDSSQSNMEDENSDVEFVSEIVPGDDSNFINVSDDDDEIKDNRCKKKNLDKEDIRVIVIDTSDEENNEKGAISSIRDNTQNTSNGGSKKDSLLKCGGASLATGKVVALKKAPQILTHRDFTRQFINQSAGHRVRCNHICKFYLRKYGMCKHYRVLLGMRNKGVSQWRLVYQQYASKMRLMGGKLEVLPNELEDICVENGLESHSNSNLRMVDNTEPEVCISNSGCDINNHNTDDTIEMLYDETAMDTTVKLRGRSNSNNGGNMKGDRVIENLDSAFDINLRSFEVDSIPCTQNVVTNRLQMQDESNSPDELKSKSPVRQLHPLLPNDVEVREDNADDSGVEMPDSGITDQSVQSVEIYFGLDNLLKIKSSYCNMTNDDNVCINYDSYPVNHQALIRKYAFLVQSYNSLIMNLEDATSVAEIDGIMKGVTDGVFSEKRIHDAIKSHFIAGIKEHISKEDEVMEGKHDSPSKGSFTPLLSASDCINYESVLKKLQIFDTVDHVTLDVSKYIQHIKYDVYRPEVKFPKTCRPTPHYRVMIFGSNEELPTVEDLRNVKQSMKDDIPLLLSIVYDGSISFFQMGISSIPFLTE